MKKIEFTDYDTSISKLLSELDFDKKLTDTDKIVIKPNLLECAPPPVTTDVRCIEAIIRYIIERKESANITVIEGSGGCVTKEAYRFLGYDKLLEKYQIRLLDVDECELTRLTNADALVYREIHLPRDIFDGFFISVPCLKDHTITTVTLGLKNMVGLLPKKYYGGYWSYNRSGVHRVGVDKAIADINTYVKIDMTIVDGRIGQAGSHLPGGRSFSPPKNTIIAGYDCLEVDKIGAEILGHNWENINHIKIYSCLNSP